MTRLEVMGKAMEGAISWIEASIVLGVTARQMRRLRERHECFGPLGLQDGRSGLPRTPRVPAETVEEILRWRQEKYAAFSIRHFHEHLVERHKLSVSYTFVRDLLQLRGLADRCSGRGRYLRKRERRPMRGMLLHLDASRHEWVAGPPPQDLNLMLDDADGRILYAQFVPEENTASTMAALLYVLERYGRFCQLYTDRGSHFCRTEKAGDKPADEQNGQVSRALRALGIEHIQAMTPEARGRSERMFGTVQGRLPQELALHGITDYDAANRFLDQQFIDDLNRRFAVTPRDAGSAFTSLAGIDLRLLLSVQHERIVQKDNTVLFGRMHLQLPASSLRISYARCPVLVHQLVDGTLGVSFRSKLLARFDAQGSILSTKHRNRRVA